MNKAESIAGAYLRRLSSCVVHEPDGNVPPDFLVDNELAVEVRTLNENYFGGKIIEGLEQDQRRIERTIGKALRQFDRPHPGQAYWISLGFSRPLDSSRDLQRSVRKQLQEFLNAPTELPAEICLGTGVSIKLCRAGKPSCQTFRIGMQHDRDSGGWVAGMYTKNTCHCIDEKTRKVSPYVARYPRWWLILVDDLSGFSPSDRDDGQEVQMLRDSLTKPELWERILVITPSSTTELIDI